MKARCDQEDCDCGHTIEKAIERGVAFWHRVEEREAGWRYALECRQARVREAPCGHCGGHGSCATDGADRGGVNCGDPQAACPHCRGVRLQEDYAGALDRLQQRFNEVWTQHQRMVTALEALCRGHNSRGSDGPCYCLGCLAIEEAKS